MSSEYKEFNELSLDDLKKTFSKTTFEHLTQPKNLGILLDASGYAKIKGPCGDTIEMWINVENERITEARFATDGCCTARAAGSMTIELAKGKRITEAERISQQDVLDAFGDFPEEGKHCCLLSTNTLKATIASYRNPQYAGHRQ